MRKTLKTAGKWILALALFAGSGIYETAEARTTVSVSKRSAPPRGVEIRPIRPSVHHIWVGGHLTVGINGITWVSGYWRAPVVRHARTRFLKKQQVRVVKNTPVRVVKNTPVKAVRAKPTRRTSSKAVKVDRK